MEITLSDGQIIDILAINLAGNTFDWKRREGYTGACVSPVAFESFLTIEADITAALESELVQVS